MPRTAIPVTTCVSGGVTPPAQTNSDFTNGMTIAGNEEDIIIEVISTDAGAQSVGLAIPAPPPKDGQTTTYPDKSIPVAAGATKILGPYKKADYNQPDGSLSINPSVNTTLKFRAYRVRV